MSQDQLFEYAKDGSVIKLGQLVASVDLNATDDDGMTALMHAAAHGHYKASGLLVGSDDSTINAQDSSGKTALMYAAGVGSNNIVKMLLKKGADPSVTDNHGQTAVDYAEANGHEKVSRRLRSKAEGTDDV